MTGHPIKLTNYKRFMKELHHSEKQKTKNKNQKPSTGIAEEARNIREKKKLML